MTEEQKDLAYLEELWKFQDEVMATTYTTRQAAKHALRNRWGIDYDTGPYAIEKRDERLFVIVLDEDGSIRAADKERNHAHDLNSLFGPTPPKKPAAEKSTSTKKYQPKPIDMSHSPFAEGTERREAMLKFSEAQHKRRIESWRQYSLEKFWSSRVNAKRAMDKLDIDTSVFTVVPVKHEGRRRYRIIRREDVEVEIKYYTSYHAAWFALRRKGEKLSDPKCRFQIVRFKERCYSIREK